MCLRKRRSAFYLPLEETIQPAEESSASEDFQSPIEGPEAAYSRKELRQLLKQAMERLPPAYRMPFLLHAVEPPPTRETAHVFQISPRPAKPPTHRAPSQPRAPLPA